MGKAGSGVPEGRLSYAFASTGTPANPGCAADTA